MSASRHLSPWLRVRRTVRRAFPTGSVTAVAGLLTLVWHGHCDAQCDYEATVIQPRPCPIFGILNLEARGLSNTGQVVGWRWSCDLSDDIAYYWMPDTGLVDIPFPASTTSRRAEDVNSAGRIVGSANFPNDGFSKLAVVYETSTGQLVNLGALPGANWSEALAVNEIGQVVGFSRNFVTGDPPHTAFLWAEGVMTPLSVPLGPRAVATDIDDQGRIVGWMGASTNDSHVFIWQDGMATDLGNAPGAFASAPTAINAIGQVLVVAQFLEDDTSPAIIRTFLWDEDEWTDLGWLPGFNRCAGLDLNDAGLVVGYCTTSAQPYPIRAFLWQDGVMMPLNGLVATPEAAVAIPGAMNHSGQIAAIGGYEAEPAGFLLEPVDQRQGDINHDCAVGLDDLVMLLDKWGPCPEMVACVGDIEGNGAVDVIDLLIILSNWTF